MYDEDGLLLIGVIEDMTLEELEAITPEQLEQLDEFDRFHVKSRIEDFKEEARDKSINARRSKESLSTSLKDDINKTPNRKLSRKEKWIPESKLSDKKESGIQKVNRKETSGIIRKEVKKLEFNSKLKKLSIASAIVNWTLFLITPLLFLIAVILIKDLYAYIAVCTAVLWIISLITFSIIKYKNVSKCYKEGRYDIFVDDTLDYIYPALLELEDFSSAKRQFIKGVINDFGFVNKYELAIANSLILKDYISISVNRGLESTIPTNWISNFRSKKVVEKLEIDSFGTVVTGGLVLVGFAFIIVFVVIAFFSSWFGRD